MEDGQQNRGRRQRNNEGDEWVENGAGMKGKLILSETKGIGGR